MCHSYSAHSPGHSRSADYVNKQYTKSLLWLVRKDSLPCQIRNKIKAVSLKKHILICESVLLSRSQYLQGSTVGKNKRKTTHLELGHEGRENLPLSPHSWLALRSFRGWWLVVWVWFRLWCFRNRLTGRLHRLSFTKFLLGSEILTILAASLNNGSGRGNPRWRKDALIRSKNYVVNSRPIYSQN